MSAERIGIPDTCTNCGEVHEPGNCEEQNSSNMNTAIATETHPRACMERLVKRYPDISFRAVEQFEKLIAGNNTIDGMELGQLGLAYRISWKSNRWSLTTEGIKFA